jgi:hypothetical protein
VPILAQLDAERARLAATVLPKSPLGDAVRYLTNQWGALQRFVEDGRVSADNNRAENQLRVVAVGRNYAESAITRSYRRWRSALRARYGPQAAHNHNRSRKAKTSSVAVKRRVPVFGESRRASARSFIVRSASR